MKTLTAALFIGGLSSRMGQDKAIVEIKGQPLWSRQLQFLRELQPEQILLSCRTKPSWCPADVKPIPDEVPSRGPLSGVAATLAQVRTSHLLVLAIDLPRMNGEVLREMWSAARTGVGVVPVIEDSFEPLCAIYPREAVTLAKAALDAGDLRLQMLIRSLIRDDLIRPWPVPTDSLAAFLNANAPEDLRQL